MSAVFASLIPTFLIIATGWLCRSTGFVSEQQWSGLERVTYVIFFPALIIDTLSRADLTTVPVLGVGGALVGAILTMAVLVLALRPLLERRCGIDGPSFTSIFQGATRWNTFVGLAVAGSLFGQRGIALIAVAIAAMVPLLNLLAFYVFIRFAGQPRQSPWAILRSFVTNPFIWSCAVGLALNLLAPPLPKPLAAYIDVIGRAALAAGLLIVGAGLDIRRLASPGLPHALSAALKLVLLPLTAWAYAGSVGVSGSDMTVTVIAASVPSASASYVLARQMGGNAGLMAEILTLQTLLALVSMPLLISLLG
ncbi:AEC family transporter [Microvirga arsenatis]|uniref:AEC family transporter n=1 Tax=Microvirga arsenatis TaxID=2692265 RepID=A0ABW9YT69_9HYPH|nr:AEC family transporter [Microvirga arsenatis]NBJ10152.1 AEC family transporter [Microvirga arsenatis]NBJ23220.1 AEC family transporter [Microvirga arsenatis]